MRTEPLISVIIPVYNTEKYLRQSIDSVLVQTYSAWELILIDDGSADGSERICDEYALKDSRIRVYHTKNRGVSAARNMGLEHAAGEWIAFLDSDDLMLPNALETYVRYSDDTDLVIAGVRYEQDGRIFYCAETERTYGYVYEVGQSIPAMERILSYIHGRIYRKSSLVHRFDEMMRFGEDRVFNLEYISRKNRIREIPIVLHKYRWVGEPSLSKRFSLDVYEHEKRILEAAERCFDDSDEMKNYFRKQFAAKVTRYYIKLMRLKKLTKQQFVALASIGMDDEVMKRPEIRAIRLPNRFGFVWRILLLGNNTLAYWAVRLYR